LEGNTMSGMKVVVKTYRLAGSNDLDDYIPEVWAAESLMTLEANMVVANLVHRDFSMELAQFGDVVNTRRPAAFTAKRKTDDDEVEVQNATATSVQVPLDQHLHTSFTIKDGESTKAFKNLAAEYLVPAIQSIAQRIDEILLMQMYQFIPNSAGKFGTALTQASIVDLREVMNINKAPLTGRNIILTPSQESDVLNVENFVTAEKTGDAGTAIRDASIGRRMGFDIYMCQNAPSIAAGNTTANGAMGAGAAAGATSLTVKSFTGALTAGSWLTIATEMTPHKIISHTETSGDTTGLVVWPALKTAVLADAVVTVYCPGAVNYLAGYDSGYCGKTPLVVNGFSVAPKTGQLISFDATASALGHYGALATPTTIALEVDRSLRADLTNTQVCAVGPAGQYGFAFHRNAIALVSRPLISAAGARVATASANGVAVRVELAREARKQGLLVTVDVLCGVKVLDTNLGAILYS